ncbi:MAG: aminoglycoside phosphotransferase family protein [Candidatus Dojkabacteria bacterium]|nr:MAG: aminoglycoside phosphotransferase family protein [Candidatus Dojkabacteria bacterium]
MEIPQQILKKVELLLNTSIHTIETPKSGFDHIVFTFHTDKNVKLLAKAKYKAVIDALAINTIREQKLSVPTPEVIAYSEAEQISIFEFIEGEMLDRLPEHEIVLMFPKVMQMVAEIHKVKGSASGNFSDVYYKKPTKSWKEFLKGKYSTDDEYYKWEKLINNPQFDGSIVREVLKYIHTQIDQMQEPTEFSLLHSDLHGGNMIVSNGKIRGLIDWSDAKYGDPLYDFSRLKLFLVGGNKEMLQIYGTFLKMSPQEQQREKLYYAMHLLRFFYFTVEEKLNEWAEKNYLRLQHLHKTL